MQGYVFNIQRFSLHDGPGIRSTVFLKGCPLRCFWCHNPEGMKPKPEIRFSESRCILCGECVSACEQHAHSLLDGSHIYDRSQCIVCGECLENCPSGALELTGKMMTVEQVLEEVLRDQPFYTDSGGGVTISGGEPLLQRDFTFAILEACQQHNIHTAIETCAYARWQDLASLLPVTDLVIIDIKHLDSEKHKAVTGIPNQRILENARRLAQTNKPLILHTPVIPTVNDTENEIAAIADFVAELVTIRQQSQTHQPARISLALLPFHRLAADKYTGLGIDYRASQLTAPPKGKMLELIEIARRRGILVK